MRRALTMAVSIHPAERDQANMSSKAAFQRALKGATHVHVVNERYPELSGVRELVKVQTNAMASRLPVDHPRYDEVLDGSWTYYTPKGYMDGDTYVHVDQDGVVIARFTVVPNEVLCTGSCVHCHRSVIVVDGRWIDPQATGDDAMWRETCDASDTFTAEHEVVA